MKKISNTLAMRLELDVILTCTQEVLWLIYRKIEKKLGEFKILVFDDFYTKNKLFCMIINSKIPKYIAFSVISNFFQFCLASLLY